MCGALKNKNEIVAVTAACHGLPRSGARLTRRTYVGLRAPPPPYEDEYRDRLVAIIPCSNNQTPVHGCRTNKKTPVGASGGRETITADLQKLARHGSVGMMALDKLPSLRRTIRRKITLRGRTFDRSRQVASHYSSRWGAKTRAPQQHMLHQSSRLRVAALHDVDGYARNANHGHVGGRTIASRRRDRSNEWMATRNRNAPRSIVALGNPV